MSHKGFVRMGAMGAKVPIDFEQQVHGNRQDIKEDLILSIKIW